VKPSIAPIGVGDLKVVKSKLARYEAGEVAHIENVLPMEKRKREHRRLHQFEEIVTTEQEREEENRRDLQSTERFEVETEAQKTMKAETRFDAGLDLSASYGPVKLGVFAKFSMSNSKEESDKAATKYAKEVVDKTLHRLVERAREQRQTRTLDEVEETNLHGFDPSEEGTTGVYRWVDKYYRWKTVNYGKRLLYQFIVPEPGAYYAWAVQTHLQSKVLPQKPTPPTIPGGSKPLIPTAITRTNYLALARQYDVEGLSAPPPEELVLGKSVARDFPPQWVDNADGTSTPRETWWAFTNEELDIPQGYRAKQFAANWESLGVNGKVADMLVALDHVDAAGAAGPGSAMLNGQSGKLAVSGLGKGITAVLLNVQVLCTLMAEQFQQWQLSTYHAVMGAYKKALLDYEERAAAAQIRGGVAIEGDNPLLNRETEREQLEWLCLVLWAGDALQNPAGTQTNNGVPWPNASNATLNARKIEFFQEAFEWNNMTYETYPYFWGRESNREDRLAMESTDPLFERFLRAGAARVVVPVKPSHTEVVLWYQLTGQIWPGGPVPALTSTGLPEAVQYNAYLTDMQGVQDVEEIDADLVIEKDDPDAHLMKVPTDLVWLQDGSELPDFEAP